MSSISMKNTGTEAPKPGQYTVFLVEDDMDDKTQIIRTLEQSPYIYNVHWFANGDSLMAHFASEGFYGNGVIHHIPMLVMLDIHLPGTSGIDILRDMKENPMTKDIPIVIITNDISNRKVLEAYQLQANAYIPKPVHLGNIHEVIYNGWGWPAKKGS